VFVQEHSLRAVAVHLVKSWRKLIGPYILPQYMTGDTYANFLQDKMPALLENVPLQTQQQMYYQHD